jgi:hypothetical protein
VERDLEITPSGRSAQKMGTKGPPITVQFKMNQKLAEDGGICDDEMDRTF